MKLLSIIVKLGTLRSEHNLETFWDLPSVDAQQPHLPQVRRRSVPSLAPCAQSDACPCQTSHGRGRFFLCLSDLSRDHDHRGKNGEIDLYRGTCPFRGHDKKTCAPGHRRQRP